MRLSVRQIWIVVACFVAVFPAIYIWDQTVIVDAAGFGIREDVFTASCPTCESIENVQTRNRNRECLQCRTIFSTTLDENRRQAKRVIEKP